MAAVMLFLRQSTGKTERYTHFCMPLKPVFTRDCGDGVHFTDEPTGNLDSRSTQEIMGILKELHAEGRTVILITHDNEIAAQAKRVIKIKDGHIESDSSRQAPPGQSGTEQKASKECETKQPERLP